MRTALRPFLRLEPCLLFDLLLLLRPDLDDLYLEFLDFLFLDLLPLFFFDFEPDFDFDFLDDFELLDCDVVAALAETSLTRKSLPPMHSRQHNSKLTIYLKRMIGLLKAGSDTSPQIIFIKCSQEAESV